MNGRALRARKAREISFMFREAGAPPLRSLKWSPQVLRYELQRLLIQMGIAPLDLMRGWDQGKDGSFSKKEFLVMMKKIVCDNDLWDGELREVVKDTFADVSGGDKEVDVIEVSCAQTPCTLTPPALLPKASRPPRMGCNESARLLHACPV